MSFATVAAIGGGASIISGVMGSNAAKQAAAEQASAMRYAADTQKQIYNQQREDQQPWRGAGLSALSQMQNPYFQQSFTSQDFQQDPGYAFRMAEGQKAIERSAAAKGGLASGATMKALNNYAQGQASGEYQNSYNRFNDERNQRYGRLTTVANLGVGATNQMNANGTNYANGMSQTMGAMGNANAAGIMGSANAMSGALGGVANGFMNASMMNRVFPGATPAIGTGTTGEVNPAMFGTNRFAGSLTGGK